MQDEETLSDREAAAERRFNEIKQRWLANKEPDRYETDKNFIESNKVSFYGGERSGSQSKLERIEKNT